MGSLDSDHFWLGKFTGLGFADGIQKSIYLDWISHDILFCCRSQGLARSEDMVGWVPLLRISS